MPHIIILDIRLGGKLSGVDLLKKIKETDTQVYIIMITGYGTIDLAVDCIKTGAYDFVTKPFSFDHFNLIIQRVTELITLKNLALERDYYLELSRIDALTELYNRRFFDGLIGSELSRSKRYGRKFCLILIDIDQFKKINDIFGHHTGDEVLKKVAQILKNISREYDFLFRYGADEFAILLPETTKEGTQIYLKRLQEKLEPLEVKNTLSDGKVERFPIQITLAYSVFPDNAATKFELIHSVDMALLEAKTHKKGMD
jgi:diguanylate cyclase (GGDEF)-like protein